MLSVSPPSRDGPRKWREKVQPDLMGPPHFVPEPELFAAQLDLPAPSSALASASMSTPLDSCGHYWGGILDTR